MYTQAQTLNVHPVIRISKRGLACIDDPVSRGKIISPLTSIPLSAVFPSRIAPVRDSSF
jgi:hypothetical protein